MGFLKKVAKVVTAPAKAAVSVVSNVAQGNISDAAKAAVSGVTSLSPVSQIETLSGGRLSDLAGNVPIVGSMGQKFISSSGTIGSSNGDFRGSDLRTYVREGAKLGAVAVGGYFAAPLLGTAGTISAAGIGSQLGSGNIRGALQSAIGTYTPEGYEGIGKVGQTLLDRKPAATLPPIFDSVFSSPTGEDSGPNVLMIGAVAIGAILLIRAYKKGKK